MLRVHSLTIYHPTLFQELHSIVSMRTHGATACTRILDDALDGSLHRGWNAHSEHRDVGRWTEQQGAAFANMWMRKVLGSTAFFRHGHTKLIGLHMRKVLVGGWVGWEV